MDDPTYYAENYQCIQIENNWVDQYGNKRSCTCRCGGKTIPMFDVTHKMYTAQCRECYKFIKSDETESPERL